VAALSTFDITLAPLDALVASALAMEPSERPQSAEDLSRPLRRFIAERDLGDLGRKVGERVRELRAAGDSQTGPDLSENSGVLTPVASETRTFATRSHEVLAREISTTPSKPPRHAAAPYLATRRMSDDAGSWSSAGGRTEAQTSVRPARARKYRGLASVALGLSVVAAAAGAAWRYGKPETGTSMPRGETAGRGENAAIHAKTLEALESVVRTSEERTPEDMHAHGDGGGAASSASARPEATLGTATGATGSAGVATSGSGVGRMGVDTALGHLRILANPMANVEIDGKPRGAAPIADIALPPGTHFVRLDCAALGEAVAQNVPVAPGETITISGDFTGAHGRILVRRASASP
jgi:hypothetical protein